MSITDEWIKKMWYIYTQWSGTYIHNGILLSHKKEWNNAICSNMDGPRDYHTKWSKSERERQMPYDITYMWNLKYETGTFLVVQWLRIHLPMQGTQVQALVQEDPTCCGATKHVRHNYWAWALEPMSHNCWTHAPRARALQQEMPLLAATREKPACSNEGPMRPKINKI